MSEATFGIWDGITEANILGTRSTRQRLAVFEAAKSKQWTTMLDLIEHLPRLDLEWAYNTTAIGKRILAIPCGTSKLTQVVEPESASHNTLLHYAVLYNADLDVIQQLIDQGAFRTRHNANGQTPLDLAKEQHAEHLYAVLEPQLRRAIPLDVLQQVDAHFYDAMMSTWAQHFFGRFAHQRPQVSVLLETSYTSLFFSIEEGCGGFEYWFDDNDSEVVLYAFSDVCYEGGSERVHKITPTGYELIAEEDEAYKYHLSSRFFSEVRPWDLDYYTFLAEDIKQKNESSRSPRTWRP